MARIHSHYDNLKVSRKAPQEVIRAAYKALSQKYHPDKNPHDEKAARIMAILNSAYGTLADPVRRREHDEWIAAEEWEIEWLESTQAEENRELLRHESGAEGDAVLSTPVYRPLRDPKWWLAASVFLVLGAAAGIGLMSQKRVLPPVLGAVLDTPVAPAAPAPEPEPEPEPQADTDTWAVRGANLPGAPLAPRVKTSAVAQLVIPRLAPACDAELHTLVAPNGDPWPQASGYLNNFPIGNQGTAMQIVVDNTANTSPVLAKVFDLERGSNVRHVYVLAGEKLTVDKLAAGRYQMRYQELNVGGSKEDCVARRKRETAPAADLALP